MALRACTYFNSFLMAKSFYDAIKEEINFHKRSKKYLNEENFEMLSAYYANEIRNIIDHGFYYAQRLKHLLAYITSVPKTPKILDTGCGFGSESILCAILNAKVTGIDLKRKRLEVARKRLLYFEDRYRRKLQVQFKLKNILRLRGGEFDIIWCNEFVSHVHPLHVFFEVARKNLRKGGILIVSDTNAMNPYTRYKAYLVHRDELHGFVIDPDSGERIMYAREYLRCAIEIKKLMEKECFKVRLIAHSGFLLPILPVSLAFLSEEALTNLPLLDLVGAHYVVVGERLA